MYTVRRLRIGKNEQLNKLAHACGELYSQALVAFWRTVRHKEIWLKPKHLQRWHHSKLLHAHTADACVEAFFAALNSWRERRKTDPNAKPPRKRKWYFKIEYKSSAIHHHGEKLILSNGRGNPPLILDWPWPMPKTVTIRWCGTEYEAVATYVEEVVQAIPSGGKVAGVDLGEVHLAVSHDGEQTYIANGRLLRSKRRYQNKLKAKLDHLIDTKKKGSHRRKRLIRSKQRQLRKLKQQIRDIEHKQTSRLISALHEHGVQMVVIGDVRHIRQDNDKGTKANQKIHQWSFGKVRHMLTYKAERRGMQVGLQEESYTTKECPVCETRRKKAPGGRNFRCLNPKCGFRYHRDGVGAMNIRKKYLDCGPVVGDMAPPTGMRYQPHARVAR
jgi:putative transposase